MSCMVNAPCIAKLIKKKETLLMLVEILLNSLNREISSDNIASKWSRCSRIFHFHLLTLYLIVLPLLWYVYFLHIRKNFVILQRNRERVIPSPYLLLYNKVFQE